MSMYQDLIEQRKTISVTGLGYVGLPLALEFARHFKVIGFDINQDRVELMQSGVDPSRELESSAFEGTNIQFTADPDVLKEAHYHIIGVPTDIDQHKVPDLRPLKLASQSVGAALKNGDYVVYESTVFPGCTREECVPILEQASGLKCGIDFKVGYSPERINPGDEHHTLTNIVKVVSGCDDEALKEISAIYGHIINAGIYEAPSIAVAEAAKVIENTQRDINIAFMNELSIIFDRMQIDSQEVLKAAGTKWNFLKFHPGLVGGHCIGVDPYYLAYKAEQLGVIPEMILSGRRLNDYMPAHIAQKVVQALLKAHKNPSDSKVLVMGMTFKQNVSDIRNSKVVDLIHELQSYTMEVHVTDPYASAEEVREKYKINISNSIPENQYDAVIVAVEHDEYVEMGAQQVLTLINDEKLLFDLKGIMKPSGNQDCVYWSL